MEEILLKHKEDIIKLAPQWVVLTDSQSEIFLNEVYPYCARTFNRLGRTSKKYKELGKFLEISGDDKRMGIIFAICSIYMRGDGL